MIPPDHDELRRRITAVRSDRSELARLAGLSFPHPNGFDRLLLAGDAGTGARLRIHAWWDGAGAAPSGPGHVHDHPWSFTSRVVAGRLHVETFAVDPGAGAGDGEHVLVRCPAPVASPTGYRWTYRAEGPARIEPAAELWLPAGARYALDFRQFHRVEPDGAVPTVSVVAHGPLQQQVTRLVVDPGASLDDHAVAPFTPDELDIRLARVLDLLPRDRP